MNLSEIFGYFEFKHFYILVVLVISNFLLLRGLFIIRMEKRRRLKQAKKMDYSEAIIPADGHDEDTDVLLSRKRAVQSIETRFHFIRKFYIPTVLIISTLLLSLPFLPTIPATYLSLLTGLVAGLFGLAAKPVIENAIAGMVITFSQPFCLNDTIIIDGNYGTVEKINLLHTVVKIWNWRRLVIPNHTMLQKEIENLTLGEEDEWAYIAFHVQPDVDIQKVKKVAKQAMQSKYLENSEPPSFWVIDMQKDSILCWVAGWASDPARAWALRSAARLNLSQLLKENNIAYQMTNTNFRMDNSVSPFN